ncbi:hypothetical protein M407DRAFT_13568 [Tulasnella calospora MUT 4182]|uniref:Ion transport domain-containing protein n=1 Tax=Tulasnella calospora MUT 4182 TaxID=1051891 RepID=A0A0C3QY55_9AGAM|nr:hypothetical protein M407DRAFT_13568 [Tulasnella calospora MUT 4182]
MDIEDEREPLLREELDAIPVYPIIHLVKADVEHYIGSSYQLTAPDLTYSLVQPLYDKYSRMRNMSVVFCFLLNRVHFLRDRNLASMPLSQSRAALCELMAIKLLRDWAESTMELATVMTTSWCIFSGAGPEVLDKADESYGDMDTNERIGNAIEMAIIGQAKRFIKSGAFQKIIDCIWSGKVVYQAESDHSFLSDTYKRKTIHFYDPRRAPLLDHYRLKVPAVRAVLEYAEFLVLFILFVIALEGNEVNKVNWSEGIFMIYALGFTLDKVAAMQEHGMKVYSANLWNAFDIALITIFMSYGSFRAYGFYYHEKWARTLGIDILALGACLMFPRLAFVTLSNNLMILSVRSMFYEFIVLMLVAAFCFCGFLYALFTKNYYSPGTIFWYMLDLYFGLDASGFDRATTFHPFFGPVLMVVYACLSNTLLLTVLVAILSNTFSTISEDAVAESMFRKAVSTIEGVKADALFSYQPPLNLFAFIVMLPLSYILSKRWFHKVNVFMIRITSLPILLAVAVYERQKVRHRTTTMQETVSVMVERVVERIPRGLRRLTLVDRLRSSVNDIDTIFDLEEELAEEAESRRISQIRLGQDKFASPENLNETEDKPDEQLAFPTFAEHIANSSRASTHSRERPSINPVQSESPRRPEMVVPIIEDPLAKRRRRSSHRNQRPTTSTLMPPDPSLLVPGLNTAALAPSPLAQIFNPIVFDDTDNEEAVSENPDDTNEFGIFSPTTSTPAITFGPASRRISMSRHKRSGTADLTKALHPRRRTQSALMAPAPSVRPGLLPTFDQPTPPVSSSHLPGPDGQMVDFPHHVLQPQTVTETEAEEEIDPDGLEAREMSERLDQLEKRQVRIEQLLERISQRLEG